MFKTKDLVNPPPSAIEIASTFVQRETQEKMGIKVKQNFVLDRVWLISHDLEAGAGLGDY